MHLLWKYSLKALSKNTPYGSTSGAYYNVDYVAVQRTSDITPFQSADYANPLSSGYSQTSTDCQHSKSGIFHINI